MERHGYMMIKEVAAKYNVSRAKLHRLVRLGKLQTAKDPRDERITLLREDEVDALFRFPEGEATHMVDRGEVGESYGRVTAELAARMDEVRARIARGGSLSRDSVDIIREERERRISAIDDSDREA